MIPPSPFNHRQSSSVRMMQRLFHRKQPSQAYRAPVGSHPAAPAVVFLPEAVRSSLSRVSRRSLPMRCTSSATSRPLPTASPHKTARAATPTPVLPQSRGPPPPPPPVSFAPPTPLP